MNGYRVKDRVTGFTGLAMGEIFYLSGCVQILVAPPVGPDGKLPEAQWMDRQRLEIVNPDELPLVLTNDNPGFEKQPPK